MSNKAKVSEITESAHLAIPIIAKANNVVVYSVEEVLIVSVKVRRKDVKLLLFTDWSSIREER